MTIALTAPITEAQYRSYPVLALPSDFTGDKVTQLLNNAWTTLTSWANQPLSQTTNTEVYKFGDRYCNFDSKACAVMITPKHLPIISVTSIAYSFAPALGGWNTETLWDIVDDQIIVYDSPFNRGDFGMHKIVYASGYATVPNDLLEACALMASMYLSCGFFPTQAGGSIMPEFVDGSDTQRYYRLRQIIGFYSRKR